MNPVDDYIDELMDWARRSEDFRTICLEEAHALGSTDAGLLLAISQFYHYIRANDKLNRKNKKYQSLVSCFSISPDSDFFNKKWVFNGTFAFLHDEIRQPFDLLVDSHPIALGYIGKICLEHKSFEQAEDYFVECYDKTQYNYYKAVQDAIPFNILCAMYYYGLYVKQDYRLGVNWAIRGMCLGDAMSHLILG